MRILDGKNHKKGLYEKYALDQITYVLNGGKFWGFLDPSGVEGRFSAEAVSLAHQLFLETARSLVDQWIESGKDLDGNENPANRYVRGEQRGYSTSLFDTLLTWLGRNMPKTALMNDGRIGILDQPPNPFLGLELEEYAREMAIYYLKEIFECPHAMCLAKCANSKCARYFERKRNINRPIKRGVYCGQCKLIGNTERTRLSRQKRKDLLLDYAASNWVDWRQSHRHPDRYEWIALQVNKKFPNQLPIHRKWVAQNRAEILKRVNAQSVALN